MKKAQLGLLALGVLILTAQNSPADTAWSSTSSSDWGTGGNWTNGLPSFGPQLAVHRGTASLQKSITLGATARETVGMLFTFTSGGTGYTFSGLGVNPGFFIRSGGSVNGILQNDDTVATFNVPVKLLDSAGLPGAGAAQTWNAAAGNLVFNGNPSAASPWTLNLNGASALTISGAFNVSIGTSGSGAVVNTNIGTSTGFIKNGSGTLFLGGSAANTFTGTNFINAGIVTAGKINALGAGNALVMAGGTFNSGGVDQTLGVLDLDGHNSTIDFGTGFSDIIFDNSSGADWENFHLNLVNWTAGNDTIRFGTDNTGLSVGQLFNVHFIGSGYDFAAIDEFGYLTPIPEPNSAGIAVIGVIAFVIARRIRSRLS